MPFLAPKYGLVDSEALLRRFAKYTLSPYSTERNPFGRFTTFLAFQQTSDLPHTPVSETFRFVDMAHLPESETPDFLLSLSKDLTSADETIVFGR